MGQRKKTVVADVLQCSNTCRPGSLCTHCVIPSGIQLTYFDIIAIAQLLVIIVYETGSAPKARRRPRDRCSNLQSTDDVLTKINAFWDGLIPTDSWFDPYSVFKWLGPPTITLGTYAANYWRNKRSRDWSMENLTFEIGDLGSQFFSKCPPENKKRK